MCFRRVIQPKSVQISLFRDTTPIVYMIYAVITVAKWITALFSTGCKPRRRFQHSCRRLPTAGYEGKSDVGFRHRAVQAQNLTVFDPASVAVLDNLCMLQQQFVYPLRQFAAGAALVSLKDSTVRCLKENIQNNIKYQIIA